MSIKLRCPHCGRFFAAPDLESVKTYAASGGMFQTLTEKITLQPVIKRYETPGPLWMAVAIALIPAALGPAEVLYFGVDPVFAFALIPVSFGVGLVIASTRVEEREIEDKPQADDELEAEPDEPQSDRLETVERPGKNSMTIRLVHEPPSSPDPVRQRILGRADLALAKLATGVNPISPVSLAKAKERGFKFGEPTFYEVQHKWVREGLVFLSGSGGVYLRPSGAKILSQYVNQ